MKPAPPTKMERRVLNCYKHFAREGISPTLAEVGVKLGISKVSVHGHANNLADKKALDRIVNQGGTYTRYMLPNTCPTCGTVLAGDGELKATRETAPPPQAGF